MSWRWIAIAALLAALVIGYGALMQPGSTPAVSSQEPEQPGYYLQDAVITQTQQDGSLGLRLSAHRIEQQPQDDSFRMSTVRVDYFRAPGRQWILTADRAVVPADSQVVHLEGDVQLRPADAEAVSFLRTDALAIDTEKNLAYSTSSPVRMQFGQHAMTVKNFSADLNSEKIRLESVDGRYAPE